MGRPGDHGPLNSWDRIPYITTMRYNNGTASIIPAPRNVHHNLFLGTYNSQENMDNDVSAGANHQSSSDIGDILVYHIILPLPVLLVTLQDGSAYYHTHDNVFIYGDNGLKSDFGGSAT